MISMAELVRRDARRDRELILGAVSRVVDSGAFVGGVEIEELEREIAAATGFRHAVAAASGTHALEAVYHVMRASRWGADAEVVMPAMSFAATATAAIRTGYRVRCVDVDDRGLMLPIRRGGGMAVAVDLWGQHHPGLGGQGVPYLIDAAQSFGRADWPHDDPMFIGATLSFYPTKTLGAIGDAGAVCTDHADLAAMVRSYLNHGRGPGDSIGIGTTGRMDALQAAVLRERLRAFPARIARRREIGRAWAEAAGDLAVTVDGEFYVFVFLAPGDRVAAMERLVGKGIACGLYYDYLLPGALASECPTAVRLRDRHVAVPLSDSLTDAEVELVASTIRGLR
jgi:dTDP-4-amino-4,6-dideoxygalactose transaminase